jgi:hypothetical protein
MTGGLFCRRSLAMGETPTGASMGRDHLVGASRVWTGHA